MVTHVQSGVLARASTCISLQVEGWPVDVKNIDQANDGVQLRGGALRRGVETGKHKIAALAAPHGDRGGSLRRILARRGMRGRVDFAARPIVCEIDSGYLLLRNELQQGVGRVLSEITQVDDIEQVANFVAFELIVW